MSLPSGISATRELKQFLDESRAGEHAHVAVVRVQIRGDDLKETARKNGPANGDLTQLEEYLDNAPAFFLLRADASSWYLATWMPEGKVGVSNRMVYASSQSSLKEAVGEACVAGTLQFTTVDEVLGGDVVKESVTTTAETEIPTPPISDPASTMVKSTPREAPGVAPKPAGLQITRTFTQTQSTTVVRERHEHREEVTEYRSIPPVIGAKPQMLTQKRSQGGAFVRKMDPRLAMSGSELEHVNMLQQEDAARSEQVARMQTRLRAPGAVEEGSAVVNHHANTAGVKETTAAVTGGFHTVKLPLSTAAKAALSDFAANVGITVVELEVEANTCVTSPRSFTSTEEFEPNAIEPRFYIMRTPGSRIFVYSCPETSPPRLRMIYSTASAETLAQIQELGYRITHRLSLFSPRDCTLVAVAATIRSGQAQRADAKPVDTVVNYVPDAPARSLPSRFAASTTTRLDAFTDEQGFRDAFASVRPDAPAPPPFAATNPSLSTASTNDAVDTSPNAGAATWGVQLKSRSQGVSGGPSSGGGVSKVASKATAPGVVAPSSLAASVASRHSVGNVETVSTHFSQTRLAGEAGDESQSAYESRESSPLVEFADNGASNEKPRAEVVRSSLPGLRPVPGPHESGNSSRNIGRHSTPVAPRDAKWDPWRSVNATSQTSVSQTNAPQSAIQSSVYTKPAEPTPESISNLMGDITYPPLQHPAGSESTAGN
ncbi:Twinfilin-1 [Coemansia sp. RSA 1365]|nr:Twinfilin-1 [Coemansia sp. RSA 1365]